MTVAVLYYHSSIITIMTKNKLTVYQSTINTARSGIGAEQVKTASFFIKIKPFFCQIQPGKLFETRV